MWDKNFTHMSMGQKKAQKFCQAKIFSYIYMIYSIINFMKEHYRAHTPCVPCIYIMKHKIEASCEHEQKGIHMHSGQGWWAWLWWPPKTQYMHLLCLLATPLNLRHAEASFYHAQLNKLDKNSYDGHNDIYFQFHGKSGEALIIILYGIQWNLWITDIAVPY